MPDRLKAVLRPYVLLLRKLRVRENHHGIHAHAWARPLSVSQFGEDLWLAGRFAEQDRGFYVDVGAYHPYNHSNTYLLYRRGWSGINLEPSPDALAEIRKHRPRDINLPYAAAASEAVVPFTLSGTFAGIADDTHIWDDSDNPQTLVQAKPLSQILNEHLSAGQTIDLLDVDCEGHDLGVLRSNDWDRYRPVVILAEAHDEASGQAIGDYLRSQDYVRRATLQLTMVFEDARGER